MTLVTNRLRTFLRSPEGQRVVAEAKKLAKDPGQRQRIDAVLRRIRNSKPPS